MKLVSLGERLSFLPFWPLVSAQSTAGASLLANASPLTLMTSPLSVTNQNVTPFGMLGGLVPVTMPFQFPLELLGFGTDTAGVTTTSGSTSAAFHHSLTQSKSGSSLACCLVAEQGLRNWRRTVFLVYDQIMGPRTLMCTSKWTNEPPIPTCILVKFIKIAKLVGFSTYIYNHCIDRRNNCLWLCCGFRRPWKSSLR